MPIRVALVDDDPFARGAIRSILGSAEEIEVVGEAEDGDEAVGLVERTGPEVLIMDLGMRRIDGVEATRLVRETRDPPEVLVLTTWDVDNAVLRALKAGATGFLLKTSSPARIVDAVRAVARGDSVLSPQSTRHVVEALTRDSGSDQRRRAKARIAALTARELDVAKQVALGRSNEEIGAALHLSAGTVKQHLAAIADKVDLRGRVLIAALLVTAGHGPEW